MRRRSTTDVARPALSVRDSLTPSPPGSVSTARVPDTKAVRDLLVSYHRLIDEAAEAQREAGVVRRLVTIGPERFAVEHVRRSLACLEHRYSAHAALADAPAPAASEDRERVAQLAASLPPPHSRLRSLAWIVVALVLARAILAVITAVGWQPQSGLPDQAPIGSRPTTKPLADAFTRLGDLSLANVGEAVDIVFASSLLTTSLVAVVFGIAAYVVLRPLIAGAIAFRVLRHGGTGSRTSWYGPEHRRATQLHLDDHEAAVFDAVGMRAPPDPWVDLAGKACLAAPLLIAATALWIDFLDGEFGPYGYKLHPDGTTVLLAGHQHDPQSGVIAALLAAAAALRLGWLVVEARRRQMPSGRRGTSWRLALALLPVLAIAFVAVAAFDHRPPSVLMVTPPWTMVASSYADYRLPRTADTPAVTVRFVCDEPCYLESAAGTRFMSEVPPRPPVSTEATLDGGGTAPVPRSLWSAIPDHVQRPAADAGIAPSADAVLTEVSVHLTAEQARAFRPPSPGGDPDTWLRIRVRDADGNYNDLDVAVRPKRRP